MLLGKTSMKKAVRDCVHIRTSVAREWMKSNSPSKMIPALRATPFQGCAASQESTVIRDVQNVTEQDM